MKQNNLEVVLHTNGLKIDRLLAQKIANLVSRISLTMDAVDASIQLQMRKSNQITNHTINLIKMFHSLNVPVTVKTVITKINKDEIYEIGKILCDLPIMYWSILEFVPLNRGKLNQSDFLLEQKEFDSIYEKIINTFPLIDIRKRKFADSENSYCFIALDGNVYAYIRGRGDVLIGNIDSERLDFLIKIIEK